MDGVLVDSHEVHRKAWERFFQTVGREVRDSELNFILDGRKRSDILRHFLGERSEAEMEQLGRRKDCIFRQMQVAVRPMPGAMRIARELRAGRLGLAVATSASRNRAHSTLVRLGIRSYFRVIVTGDDVEAGKPDAQIYRMASRRMGVAPEHLLAFEDSASGIQAAVSAGVACIGITSRETAEKLMAAGAIRVTENFECVRVDELESILRCMGPPVKPNAARPG